MSAVTANFTVSPVNLSFTVDNNNINFTPNAISLGIFTGGQYPIASGLNANVANVHIFDGVNGYVLQTDGLGNLSWTAQGGNGGNGTPGGANTQVQFNDAGLFGGNTGFTFNKTTGVLTANGAGLTSIPGANVTGSVGNATNANAVAGANVSGAVSLATYATTANAVAGANVSGTVANATYAVSSGTAATVTTAAQPNITSVGTLTSLTVSGTIASGNANLGNLATANFFSGNGSLLTGISTSQIANGNSNINISTANGNINFTVSGIANTVVISNIGPQGSQLITTDLRVQANSIILGQNSGSNITGVYQGAIMIGGQIANNSIHTRIAIGQGAAENVTNGEQNINIGPASGANAEGVFNIGLGHNSGQFNSGNYNVALGYHAGRGSNISTGSYNIAIGDRTAGYNYGSNYAIMMGSRAGNSGVGDFTIAMGYLSCFYGAGTHGVALGTESNIGAYGVSIGYFAGYQGGSNSVAIGRLTGYVTQGANAVAIGANAGSSSQGANSVAIGANAGPTSQHANSIIINATGANFNSTQADSFFVKPIRDVTGNASFSVQLYYNPTTGEVGYK